MARRETLNRSFGHAAARPIVLRQCLGGDGGDGGDDGDGATPDLRGSGGPRGPREANVARRPLADVWSAAMSGDEIPRDLPQVGDELAGQYEITAVIATSAMGVLLRARQKSLMRPVVVKFMLQAQQDPASTERFMREARAAGRISEPHVVGIFDCGFAVRGRGEKTWLRASAGVPFIVME